MYNARIPTCTNTRTPHQRTMEKIKIYTSMLLPIVYGPVNEHKDTGLEVINRIKSAPETPGFLYEELIVISGPYPHRAHEGSEA